MQHIWNYKKQTNCGFENFKNTFLFIFGSILIVLDNMFDN